MNRWYKTTVVATLAYIAIIHLRRLKYYTFENHILNFKLHTALTVNYLHVAMPNHRIIIIILIMISQ